MSTPTVQENESPFVVSVPIGKLRSLPYGDVNTLRQILESTIPDTIKEFAEKHPDDANEIEELALRADFGLEISLTRTHLELMFDDSDLELLAELIDEVVSEETGQKFYNEMLELDSQSDDFKEQVVNRCIAYLTEPEAATSTNATPA